jgi:hypothetical protein
LNFLTKKNSNFSIKNYSEKIFDKKFLIFQNKFNQKKKKKKIVTASLGTLSSRVARLTHCQQVNLVAFEDEGL